MIEIELFGEIVKIESYSEIGEHIKALEHQNAELREALEAVLDLIENERPDWQHKEQADAREVLAKMEE